VVSLTDWDVLSEVAARETDDPYVSGIAGPGAFTHRVGSERRTLLDDALADFRETLRHAERATRTAPETVAERSLPAGVRGPPVVLVLTDGGAALEAKLADRRFADYRDDFGGANSAEAVTAYVKDAFARIYESAAAPAAAEPAAAAAQSSPHERLLSHVVASGPTDTRATAKLMHTLHFAALHSGRFRAKAPQLEGHLQLREHCSLLDELTCVACE